MVRSVTARPFASPAPGDLHDRATATTPGQGQLDQRQRDQPLPGEPLQLVLAKPRVGHPQPDHDEREQRRSSPASRPSRAVVERALPAAQEEHRRQGAEHHDAGVLGEQEQREPQTGVLGVGAEDDLRVGDRHVERRPLQLGEPGDEEDHGAGQLPEQPPGLPGLDDAGERQRAGGHRDRRGGEQRRAARRPSAGRRCAARRAASTCSRWPSRPSASRAPRRPSRRGRRRCRRRAPGRPSAARAGWRPAPRGTGTRATAGASRKTVRSAAAGTTSSFCDELDAVGDQLGPAVEATGVHRPDPALHVGHRLVLGLTDEQRQGEERAEHEQQPQHHLERVAHGTTSGGPAAWRPASAGPRCRGRARRVAGSCAGRVPRTHPRRTPPAPWRPARPSRPGRPARSTCAAGCPRTRRAAAAARGSGGR